VTLPVGAREETATAKYAKGILEIRVALGEPKPAGRTIEIETVAEPEGKQPKTTKK
jgi:HSP20 family molecular chaperone IbpA